MPKYYFSAIGEENCYTKEYYLSNMEQGQESVILFEAIKVRDNDFIYCRVVDEPGERGNCGKICEEYEPRNGRSGICKHQGNFNEPGEKVILTNKGKIKYLPL